VSRSANRLFRTTISKGHPPFLLKSC
jgi:hypothetical protein